MNPAMMKVLKEWEDCRRCRLWKTRSNYVHTRGRGHDPSIAFVGEGPGRSEDEFGLPFVGRAGELLQAAIMEAEILSYIIANIVGCWPPNNRVPKFDEVKACRPRLHAILQAVPVKVIVPLGNSASRELLQVAGFSIMKERGKAIVREFAGKEWKILPTIHPSAVLRDGGRRSPLFELVVADLALASAIACGGD